MNQVANPFVYTTGQYGQAGQVTGVINTTLGTTAVPILEGQVNRLNAAAEALEMHAARLHSLADRLLGLNPEAGKDSCAAPSPTCAVGKMNEAHERISLASAKVSAALSRLETL